VWKSKFYGAFVLDRRVVLHAIDATVSRWRGDAGSSPRRETLISTQVELVPGWVAAGNEALGGTAQLFEGDITDFTFALPAPTYDLIMMNDSMEHIMANRYACLFRRLRQYTKPGSVVYIHVPSPETQLDDKGQYFENVVPPHLLIEGMAAYGFQLRHYGQDMRTLNGIKNRRGTYKYVDILFQRASTDEVFKAGR
jgi:hypothetical protein